jgi:MCP family monocarboxylic acid transporter-like MFS transporter 14
MYFFLADGVTYSFGVFYDEFLNYFEEGKAATAWILSILVGVTLCSGKSIVQYKLTIEIICDNF